MQTASQIQGEVGQPTPSNDYHQLPATEKQLQFARKIAQGTGITLPWDVQQDRRALSNWIDENRSRLMSGPVSSEPSSKQVAFAERIAWTKRRAVPQECFRDRTMMSRWIDNNR
jgi:hypothetical protein